MANIAGSTTTSYSVAITMAPGTAIPRSLHNLLVALHLSAMSTTSTEVVGAENHFVLKKLVRCWSLFEATISLLEGFLHSSTWEAKGLLEHARRLGLDTDSSDFAQIEERRRSIVESARTAGVSPRGWKDERDAATVYGRGTDYWAWQLAHEMTHGSDLAMLFRAEPRDPNTTGLKTRTQNPALIVGAACFAARSLLQAQRAASSVLNWQLADDIGDLETQLNQLESQYCPAT